MGKGNRTKQQQAANILSGTGKKRNAGRKREMPTWVGTMIVVFVLVAVILFSAFCILNSRGVFLRSKTIVKSEHFEVNVPMMSYMVYTEYQNWVNNYQNSGYMQYIKGEGGDGLNTSLPLREQNYSVTTDSATGATTTVTWFDYFANQAASSVEQVIVLCEQAHSLGITLTDEELAKIDSSIQMIELYAAYSGYTTSGYLAAMYGKGVGLKDVREMTELIELATKMTNLKTEEFKNGATDVRVENYYNENKEDIDIYVDFISYTFVASFAPVADTEQDAATKNEEKYDKYEEDKAKYEERVDALAACTTAQEFCDLLIEYLIEDGLTEVEAIQKQSDAHNINYKKDELDIDVEDWLYDTEAPVEAGDTHAFKERGDEAREDDEEGGYVYNKTSATYTACFVLKPVHRDDAYLQNVGHILFKTDTFKNMTNTSKLSGKTKDLADSLLAKGQTISAENMAKALVELMIAEGKMITKTAENGETYYYMEKDAFEAYAKEYTEDSGVFYEDVKRGDMVTEFDAWIYDEARIQNEVSPSAIETTYGYHIMFYNGHTDEINWRVTASNAIATADYEAWYKTVSAACTIDVNAEYWAKIN